MTQLRQAQLQRYQSHLLVEEIGESGQQSLMGSTVLIVGLGGLGCAAVPYLAASGVGKLILADFDEIELGNLQRQILYYTDNIGKPKVHIAASRVIRLNPDVDVEMFESKVTKHNLSQLVAKADLVLDCSDNIETRIAISKACKTQTTPLISGAAMGVKGQVISFSMKQNHPCYQCVYPDVKETTDSCQNMGVLSPLVGIIGCHQALQALKLLAGLDYQANQLFLFDALQSSWQPLDVEQNPQCPFCAGEPE